MEPSFDVWGIAGGIAYGREVCLARSAGLYNDIGDVSAGRRMCKPACLCRRSQWQGAESITTVEKRKGAPRTLTNASPALSTRMRGALGHRLLRWILAVRLHRDWSVAQCASGPKGDNLVESRCLPDETGCGQPGRLAGSGATIGGRGNLGAQVPGFADGFKGKGAKDQNQFDELLHLTVGEAGFLLWWLTGCFLACLSLPLVRALSSTVSSSFSQKASRTKQNQILL